MAHVTKPEIHVPAGGRVMPIAGVDVSDDDQNQFAGVLGMAFLSILGWDVVVMSTRVPSSLAVDKRKPSPKEEQ